MLKNTTKLTIMAVLLTLSMASASAIDINDSQSLDYWSDSTLDFRVDTDGTIQAQNKLNLNSNNITSLDSIESFFGACSNSDEYVHTINADGSVVCATDNTDSSVENLSETLTAGNVANQSIFMSDNNITNPGFVDTVDLDNPSVGISLSSNRYRITANSIDNGLIVDNNVTNSSIDSFSSFTFQDLDVTNDLTGTGIVGSTQIASNAVTNTELGSGSVNNDSISSFNSFTLQNLELTSDLTGSGIVGTTQLASNSVTSGKIGTGAVGNSEIANNVVNRTQLDGGDCTSNQVLRSDGSDFNCVSTSNLGTDDQNLSEVLEQGNVANQSIDMSSNIIENIGASGTDFDGSGNLDIASPSNTGGALDVGGNVNFNGNLNISFNNLNGVGGTQCGDGEFIDGIGDCESPASSSDNQRLDEVLSQGNYTDGYGISVNGSAIINMNSNNITNIGNLDGSNIVNTGNINSGAVTGTELASSVSGTGLSGGGGSALSVDYGSSAGTAAEGSTTVDVSSGTGLSGGGSLTVGDDTSSVTLNIANGGVDTTQLATGAVSNTELQNSAVNTTQIIDDTIQASDISSNTITASEVASNTLTASEIASGAIGNSELASNSVQSGNVQTGAVGNTEIANNAVNRTQLDGSDCNSNEVLRSDGSDFNCVSTSNLGTDDQRLDEVLSQGDYTDGQDILVNGTAQIDLNDNNINDVGQINSGGQIVKTGGSVNVTSGSVTSAQRMCLGDRCS